jgi:hypothetical protein
MDFAGKDVFYIKVNPELTNHAEFYLQNGHVEEWCDQNCKDDFLFLMETALFKNEKDALMFKLKFGA